MKHKDLENCPLCDGKAELKTFKGMFIHGWVGCPKCSLYINWNVDPDGAIKKCNKRVRKDVA